MIKGFLDKGSEDIYHGLNSKSARKSIAFEFA